MGADFLELFTVAVSPVIGPFLAYMLLWAFIWGIREYYPKE